MAGGLVPAILYIRDLSFCEWWLVLEIIDGIHRADQASGNMAHSNVYVVVDGKSLNVIDAATPGNAKKIVAYVQEMGYQPKDVSAIIATHYHVDHVGSLKELKDLTGAKVAVSEIEGDYVSGKKPYPRPKNLLRRVASSLIKAEPADVDLLLRDGMTVGSLKVVEAPGHTPGSIMLYHAERKALFAGDTLRLDGGKVTKGPKEYTWDEAQEMASIEKVSILDFDVLLPGHGDFIKGDASRLVKEYLQSSKS